VTDITERKQAENALRESEERYRSLTDAMPDLVFIVNRDDKVEYVNNVAAKYLNLLPQEVIGRARSDLFPPEASPSQELELQKVFENGDAVRNIVEKTAFCGREVWLDTQIVPLKTKSGLVTAVMGVSRDVTEFKRSEEILRNAKEAAEAATRAKSEFLANMSHEIRTPMNAVIGMTGLLLDEDLTTNQKECLETIRRSGESLLSIINNILDLSKIEAGVTDLECQPFELIRCVETSLDLVSADANKKGISTRCEFDDDTPAVILGDPTRLSQILVNLLNNSVKFTETGEISVAVSGKRLEGEKYEIHFAVKDTGIGIPQDKMGRLFQSFSQIDSSTTRKYGGTGLGLAISKKLVEMMNGTIWVESEAGSGTTFHFTIKVEKTLHEPIDINKLDSISNASLNGKLDHHLSILLAEDNLVNQMVTQRMLNKLGCRADVASNGIEVLRALERQSYDVVIMDVLMPEMDGLEATREIRRRWPESGPKIIAMTASVLKGDRETCLAAGMDGYISKPAKLVELKSALESYVSHEK
jgi:PAS domain S-box-containing protein